MRRPEQIGDVYQMPLRSCPGYAVCVLRGITQHHFTYDVIWIDNKNNIIAVKHKHTCSKDKVHWSLVKDPEMITLAKLALL